MAAFTEGCSTVASVGSPLPDVTLYENLPSGEVKLRSLFEGKKGILFGVPGAFTPGCSKTHLPGYVAAFETFKAAGAEVIVCVCPNDVFVTAAWGEAHGAGGKVTMLADPHLHLTKALGITLDAEGLLGTKRMRRFSAVVQDNVIKAFNLEAGGELTCSLSEPTLDQLKALA